MKSRKSLILRCISIFGIVIAAAYLFLVVIFPVIINSDAGNKCLTNFLFSKYDINLQTNKFRLKISPLLTVNLKGDSLLLLNKENLKIAEISNFDISYNYAIKRADSIKAAKLYIDGDNVGLLDKRETKNNKQFKISNIPFIDINEVKYISGDLNITINNLLYDRNDICLSIEIISSNIQHVISAGDEGSLYIYDDGIWADNFGFKINNKVLYIDGLICDSKGDNNFNIKGSQLAVSEIQKILLRYQKSQDPAKKFIENFRDFGGTVDIDLICVSGKIYGKCIINNLTAKTVMFGIPILFPNAEFLFNGDRIISKAEGTIGGEKAIHVLDIVNLGTPEKQVNGYLTASVSDSFARTYIPNTRLLNVLQAKLTYNIKNKVIDVQYLLDLKENSDIFYKNAYLGLRDKNRRFYVNTIKQGNNFKINEYRYFTHQNGVNENILYGDGLLLRQNGKMIPQFVTFKTQGYAPASVTGSFKKYITGGEFLGNLKYDFTTGKLLGEFDIVNAKFKEFFVNSAKISAQNDIVRVNANGTYYNEHFNCNIISLNGFLNEIMIKDMNLYLDKFVVKSKNSTPKKKVDISSKVKDSDITVNNWKIRVKRLIKDRIVLDNIELSGSLKNDVFNFLMKELSFADGILSASGKYDFKDDSSEVNFTAKGISSETVSDIVFNLPGQFVGTADATLKVNTKEKFSDVKGDAYFKIEKGFLPKLGSIAFMVKNVKQIKISDLVNVDLTRRDALQSDIAGTFSIDNYLVKNVNITTKQIYLSTLIQGSYNINTQETDLNLYGKYNSDAPKGVKVLFVPLNWVLKALFRPEGTYDLYKDKLEKIPPISGASDKNRYFRIKLTGDLNKENISVEIKGIKG